jgi:hypothetical protein
MQEKDEPALAGGEKHAASAQDDNSQNDGVIGTT